MKLIVLNVFFFLMSGLAMSQDLVLTTIVKNDTTVENTFSKINETQLEILIEENKEAGTIVFTSTSKQTGNNTKTCSYSTSKTNEDISVSNQNSIISSNNVSSDLILTVQTTKEREKGKKNDSNL